MRANFCIHRVLHFEIKLDTTYSVGMFLENTRIHRRVLGTESI